MSDGYVFRSVNRGDKAQGKVLSEKVVWQMLRPYAAAAGVPGIAPHDCRRPAAKLYRAAGGELEQIQLLLGHASVQTTERYLGTKQDLVHAPNDAIKLRAVSYTHLDVYKRQAANRAAMAAWRVFITASFYTCRERGSACA